MPLGAVSTAEQTCTQNVRAHTTWSVVSTEQQVKLKKFVSSAVYSQINDNGDFCKKKGENEGRKQRRRLQIARGKLSLAPNKQRARVAKICLEPGRRKREKQLR